MEWVCLQIHTIECKNISENINENVDKKVGSMTPKLVNIIHQTRKNNLLVKHIKI